MLLALAAGLLVSSIAAVADSYADQLKQDKSLIAAGQALEAVVVLNPALESGPPRERKRAVAFLRKALKPGVLATALTSFDGDLVDEYEAVVRRGAPPHQRETYKQNRSAALAELSALAA